MAATNKYKRKKLIKEAMERYKKLFLPKNEKLDQAVNKRQATDVEAIAGAAAQQPDVIRCFGYCKTGVVVRVKALNSNDGLSISDWARKQVAGKEVYLLPSEELFKRRIKDMDVVFKTVIPLDSVDRIAIPASWIKVQEKQLRFNSNHCFVAES